MDIPRIGALFENISEKCDNFWSDVDEAISCQEHIKYVEKQLQAVGGHIKGFWTEIVQDKKTPKSVDVKEQEAPIISESQVPTANVDDEKDIVDMCPSPAVNVVNSDNDLQTGTSSKQNEVVVIYDNSGAEDETYFMDESGFSSPGSLESISDYFIDSETSKHVEIKTEVSSDQQTANSAVPSSERAVDLLGSKAVMEPIQSQHTKLKLNEDFVFVNSSEIPPTGDLERSTGASEAVSVETKVEPVEDLDAGQNQVREESAARFSSDDEVDWVFI